MTKILEKAMIKTGAIVGQDFHWAKWRNDGEIFDVESKGVLFEVKGERVLTAPGYGEMGNYGNGSLFVKEEDLIYIDDNYPSSGTIKYPYTQINWNRMPYGCYTSLYDYHSELWCKHPGIECVSEFIPKRDGAFGKFLFGKDDEEFSLEMIFHNPGCIPAQWGVHKINTFATNKVSRKGLFQDKGEAIKCLAYWIGMYRERGYKQIG
jgi:hypothetical protein